jgi:hypothetical protein
VSDPLPPDDAHRRPDGVTDAVVEATGKLSEALEWIERARGRLYDLHQMIGRADFYVGDAADLLEEAGHGDLAQRLRTEIVGRNVLPGRWTFQIVEEFDDGYWEPVRALEREVRDALVGGRKHVFEAELKEDRRTKGQPGHESRPDEPAT